MTGFLLQDLETIVSRRAEGGGPPSYTRELLSQGVDKCARKLGEEAIEAILAATTGKQDDLKNEAADLLYHLLVLLKAKGVSLQEVMAELESRTAQSGLEEKASRQNP